MDDMVVTIDTDWAPDCTIDFVADQLLAHQVRATWFVTHMSPALARLQQYPDLFELGIHPNFLPNSTHGDTPEAVLHTCMALVPEALSMRTHDLIQSTSLLQQIVAQSQITTDVSLFLPHTPALRPVEYLWSGKTFLRIPYFWADDYAMAQPAPCWQLAPLLTIGTGLKVFGFHPIHIYLNAADSQPYQALKQRTPKLADAASEVVQEHVQTGEGPGTLFTELLTYLATHGPSRRIRDLSEQWQHLKRRQQL